MELLPHLSDTPERIRQELDVQISLGQALTATKGHAAPEVEQAFTRARALCEQVGETSQLFLVLAGLRTMYEARGELPQARELAEQLLSLAQREQDPVQLMRAYNVLGATSLYLGAFAPARAYLDQGIALDALPRDRSAPGRPPLGPSRGQHPRGQLPAACCLDPVVSGLSSASAGSGAMRPSRSPRSWRIPIAWSMLSNFAAELHCLRREAPAAQAQAEAMMVLARQQEFPARVVRGTVLRGWALAAQGQSAKGMAQIRQGMDAQRSMGTSLHRPYDLALLAEASGWIGKTAEALRLLDEALALTHQYGGHFYQAEVHRLTGEVLLMRHMGGDVSGDPAPELPTIDGHEAEATGPSPRPIEAETWFRQALDVARRQQAKSLELRAAMSLSRLWQQQGRRTDAYQLLAPSTVGSPRGSTPRTCKTPRHCLIHWRAMSKGEDRGMG